MFMLAVVDIHVHHLLSLTLTMPWRGILLVCLRYLAALQLITARLTLTVKEESNDLVPTLHSSRGGNVSAVSCMRDCYGPTWASSTPPDTAFRFTGSLQRAYCPLSTCTSLYQISVQYPVLDGVRLSVIITRLDDGDRLRADLRCVGNGNVGRPTLNGIRVKAGRLEWSRASIDEEHGWFNYREQLVGGGIASRWTWKVEIDCEENTLTTTFHTSTTEAKPTIVSGSLTSTYSTTANPISNTTGNSTSSTSANPTPTSSSPAFNATSIDSDEQVEPTVRNQPKTTIIASATAGGALLVIVFLIIIVIMCRRQRANNSSTKTPKDCKDVPLTVTNGDPKTLSPSSLITGSKRASTRSYNGYSTIDVDFTLRINSGLNSNVYKLNGDPEPSNTTDLYAQVDGHKKCSVATNTAELYTLVNKPTRPTEIPLVDMVENDLYNT